MNIPKILNEARDYKKENPSNTVFDFLSLNNYTQTALGTHEYDFLVKELAKKFSEDKRLIELHNNISQFSQN